MSSPESEAKRVIGFDGSRNTVRVLTGTETYAQELLRELAHLTAPGELRVYLNASDIPETLPPGLDYRPIPMPRLWTHARLSREMVSDPPGVLFVPAHVIPPRHPRSVVTIHDVAFRTRPGIFSRRERTELDAATRWNLHTAEAIIAVSRTTRNDLIEHYGTDPSRIYVVHHGVSDRYRSVGAEEIASARLHLGLGNPFLLAVGTQHPRKNFDLLIHAFDRLDKRFADFHLVIAGAGGPATGGLERRIDRSPRSDQIHLPGYVPAELLPGLFAAAELFMLPSWYEGFGMPALQAMAAGTPVLAASTGALPETCGGAAGHVPPDDPEALVGAIELILDDRVLRTAMITRGLNHARQFTWERAALMTLRVLRAIRDDQPLTEDSLGWLDASHRFKATNVEPKQ